MEHRYRLAYMAVPIPDGGMTKAEIQQRAGELRKLFAEADDADVGFTDALVLSSLLFPPDGSFSSMVIDYDGRDHGDRVPTIDMFKAFMHFARTLGLRGDLEQSRRDFCWDVWNDIMESMFGKRQTREEARGVDAHNARVERVHTTPEGDDNASD